MAVNNIPYPWNENPDDNAQGADGIRGSDRASSVDDTLRKVAARTKSALVVAEANDRDLQGQIDAVPDITAVANQRLAYELATDAAEGDLLSPVDTLRVGVSPGVPPIGIAAAAYVTGASGFVITKALVGNTLDALPTGSPVYAVSGAGGWTLGGESDRASTSPRVGVVVTAQFLWLDFTLATEVKVRINVRCDLWGVG